MLLVCAGVLSVLPDRLLRQVAPWRPEILAVLWGGIGLLAVIGASLRVEGGVSWFPVFGMDGPTLPMLVLLAFTGGVIGKGYRGLACVLTGLAFLALSPLVFGLLSGTALVMLADRGRQGVCLPAAIIPACIPADSPLSPPALCFMVLLLGWAVSSQKGPQALLPAGIGLFLLGRLLAEVGVLSPIDQGLLPLSGGVVALSGGVQALRASSASGVASGLTSAGFGAQVLLLTLALSTSLEGAEQFRTATLLGMGAPFLALLALLWLCKSEATDTDTAGQPFFSSGTLVVSSVAGRIALSAALLMLSGLPPLGGFSVLWCLLTAGELAAVGAQPVQALCTILVLVCAALLMVLGLFGLMRIGVEALAPSRKDDGVMPQAANAMLVLPSVVCLAVAAGVALLPGGWLALVDHLFVGTSSRDFTWAKVATVWFVDTPVSFTPAFCVLALGVCLGAVVGVGRVLRLYPFSHGTAVRAEWCDGAPVLTRAGESVAETEESSPQIWRMLTVFLGLDGKNLAEWPVVEKTQAGGHYLQGVLFKGVAWCEAQGMVLILLFLGAGLFLGLFAGK